MAILNPHRYVRPRDEPLDLRNLEKYPTVIISPIDNFQNICDRAAEVMDNRNGVIIEFEGYAHYEQFTEEHYEDGCTQQCTLRRILESECRQLEEHKLSGPRIAYRRNYFN